jgi:hypothetical protein
MTPWPRTQAGRLHWWTVWARFRWQMPGCFVNVHRGAEAKFLTEIKTKVLRVFLLSINNHLYSFAVRFQFLETHTTSYSFVKEKG